MLERDEIFYDTGYRDAISDVLTVVKAQHMCRSCDDDFDRREIPLYRDLYASIYKLKECHGED